MSEEPKNSIKVEIYTKLNELLYERTVVSQNLARLRQHSVEFCPTSLLGLQEQSDVKEQLKAMEDYLWILDRRIRRIDVQQKENKV